MSRFRVVGAIAARPRLWPVAARQAVRIVPARWWARPPFLPLPDRSYLRFRSVTNYGGSGEVHAEPEDVVSYLLWCRHLHRYGG